MRETPRVLTSASVCVDHVSQAHREEGMTSTRVYQALACGAATVSTQDPELFPEDVRHHVEFAKDEDDMVSKALRLHGDTAARCALRHGSQSAARRHSIARGCRHLWEMMREDLARLSTSQ